MDESPGWEPHGLNESLSPYMVALGVLHRNWLDAERAIEFLLWHYLGADRDTGEAITTHIGNVTRAHILSSLANIKEKDTAALASVEHAINCYDTLRTNRNYLAHSQMGGVLDDGLMTFRVLSRGKVTRESLPVSLARIRSAADRTAEFKLHLYRLRNHLQNNGPLPDKFPKPHDLLTLLRQDRDRKKP